MAYKNVPNIIIENARIIFETSEAKSLNTIGLETGTSVSSSKIRNRRRNSPMMDGM